MHVVFLPMCPAICPAPVCLFRSCPWYQLQPCSNPLSLSRRSLLPSPKWPAFDPPDVPPDKSLDLSTLAPDFDLPNLDIPLETDTPETPFNGALNLPPPKCAGACYVHALQVASE